MAITIAQKPNGTSISFDRGKWQGSSAYVIRDDAGAQLNAGQIMEDTTVNAKLGPSDMGGSSGALTLARSAAHGVLARARAGTGRCVRARCGAALAGVRVAAREAGRAAPSASPPVPSAFPPAPVAAFPPAPSASCPGPSASGPGPSASCPGPSASCPGPSASCPGSPAPSASPAPFTTPSPPDSHPSLPSPTTPHALCLSFSSLLSLSPLALGTGPLVCSCSCLLHLAWPCLLALV
jgi:hypothetical protein